MTYNGAQTTTESAMRETLGFGELTKAEINQSYKNLMDYFMGLDAKIQFDIANSIWYRLGFTVEDDFLEFKTNPIFMQVCFRWIFRYRRPRMRLITGLVKIQR